MKYQNKKPTNTNHGVHLVWPATSGAWGLPWSVTDRPHGDAPLEKTNFPFPKSYQP